MSSYLRSRRRRVQVMIEITETAAEALKESQERHGTTQICMLSRATEWLMSLSDDQRERFRMGQGEDVLREFLEQRSDISRRGFTSRISGNHGGF